MSEGLPRVYYIADFADFGGAAEALEVRLCGALEDRTVGTAEQRAEQKAEHSASQMAAPIPSSIGDVRSQYLDDKSRASRDNSIFNTQHH